MNKVRHQVFVSSTFKDLIEERRRVQHILLELNCIPSGMEWFPATDEEQFKFITKVIDDCDYYVLLIAGRYGSTTAEGISYTEREFDYAVARGIPVLVFPHKDPSVIAAGQTELDPTARERLTHFRLKACANRLVKGWSSADELAAAVATSLVQTMSNEPRPGWVRGPAADTTDLLQQINALRIRNEELEREVASLRPSHTIPPEVLAKGSEVVLLSGSMMGGEWRISVSWDDILRFIGPDLLQWVHDDAVANALGRAVLFYKRSSKSAESFIGLNSEPFRTVRVQMMALGYVDVQSFGTTAGTKAMFWTLTPRGKQRMLELTVVRTKQSPESPESPE